VLHRRDGLTYDEIAERLNISASMVKKYLSAGIRHCREHLRSMGHA
jgi:RNA polymerase sigma-70 factor (ECF subfamily)